MKDLIRIIKFLLVDTYRLRKNENRRGKIGVYGFFAIVYILFEIAVLSTVVPIAPLFKEARLVPEFLTAIMTLGLSAVTVLGVMPMLNLLYFSKDSEFFLNLPISPTKVYFAKLVTVYLSQFIFTSALIIPALFAVGITLNLSWLFYITILFTSILLPVFPLMAISVICLPLMYLIKFFKNRGAASSIVAMFLFLAVFAVYTLVIGSASVPETDAELLPRVENMIRRISEIFVPLAAVNRFATFTNIYGLNLAVSMTLDLIIFIAPALILFGLTLAIGKTAYSRAVTLQLENVKRGSRESIYKRPDSALKALILKEWKNIIRTPVFAVQCFMGLILAPLIFIIMALGGNNFSQPGTEGLLWLLFIIIVQLIVISINVGASTSFSRDGNSFYINKILPVPYDKQLRAKIIFYNSIYDVDLVICVALMYFIIGASFWWVGLLALIYLIVLNYGCINLWLFLDISKPNLEWKSYREIVKNSRNAMLPVVVGMVITFAVGVLSVFLLYLFGKIKVLNIGISATLIITLLTTMAAVFAVIFRVKLKNKANKFFDRIEC